MNTFSQWSNSSPLNNTSFYIEVGPSKLYGDIGGYIGEKNFFSDTKLSYGIGLRYAFSQRLGLSLLYNYTSLYLDSDENTHLSYRDMKFMSSVHGFETQLEVALNKGSYIEDYNPHRPYIFGGFGYNLSYSQFGDTTKIRLEDQYKYNEKSFSFIGGLGYQYRFNKNFSVGIEQKTILYFSDFIDGYHPVNSKHNDIGMNLRIIFSYHIAP